LVFRDPYFLDFHEATRLARRRLIQSDQVKEFAMT